jgi:NAD(P)-dependent dehydrogenase (short-subunit alcohol dehydrogenase family)
VQELKGKVAVVTGAASGIGRGLAERFAAEGMRVVLADVEEPALGDAERAITATGAEAIAVRTDVSDAAAVEALAQRTVERFGGVHVVCNNAGVGSSNSSWEEPLEDWNWVLGVNLHGVINGIRSFVPIMLRQGDEGHIVNTASVAGLLPGAAPASYTASKYAVVGLTEMLHHELALASEGRIGASVLCPGLIATRIHEAGRNRPGGPPAEPAAGTPEAAMREAVRSFFAGGMPPAQVAGMVVDAIRSTRFYILTHDTFNSLLDARARAILSGEAPPLASAAVRS